MIRGEKKVWSLDWEWYYDFFFCWDCDKRVIPGQQDVTYVDCWCGRFCLDCDGEVGIC